MRDSNPQDVFVGLDYHSRTIQVSVVDVEGREVLNRRCDNDVGAVASLCEGAGRVRRIAIEACSGAADFCHHLVEMTGWSTDLAHPGYVARIKQSPDKSDHSDARLLADLTRAGYLPKVWFPPTYIRELRLFDSARDSLVIEARRCKQRIRAVLREQRIPTPQETGRPWTRAWLRWLREKSPLSVAGRIAVTLELARLEMVAQQKTDLEAQMRAFTRVDRVVAALMQEPGIGEVIAWKLRARIGRFDRFIRSKQLARYCGLSPCNASTGQRQADRGLIHACDRSLRAMLLQAAHQLRRRQPTWGAFMDHLVRRGKPRSVAIAALANRWVRGLHHRMKEVSRTDT